VEALPLDDAKRNFDVNYWAVVRLTQFVLPHMRQSGGGTVVVISSILGQTYVPFASAYVATKHALEGWADALRVELRPFGIKVVIIQPGFCATEFKQVALKETNDSTHPTAILPGLEASSPYHTRMCNVIGLLNFTEQWWTSSRVVARRIVRASQAQRQGRIVTGWLGRPLLWVHHWAGPRLVGVLYRLVMRIPWSRLGKQSAVQYNRLPSWKKTLK
jgi:short-subunit dehydrogenase